MKSTLFFIALACLLATTLAVSNTPSSFLQQIASASPQNTTANANTTADATAKADPQQAAYSGSMSLEEIDEALKTLELLLGKAKALVLYQDQLRESQTKFENSLVDTFGGDMRSNLTDAYSKMHVSLREEAVVKERIDDNTFDLVKRLLAEQLQLREAMKVFYGQVAEAHTAMVTKYTKASDRQKRLREFANRVAVQAGQMRLAFDTLQDQVAENLARLNQFLLTLRNGTNETTTFLNDKSNTMYQVLGDRLKNDTEVSKESYRLLADRSLEHDKQLDRLTNHTRSLRRTRKLREVHIGSINEKFASVEAKAAAQDERLQKLFEKIDLATREMDTLQLGGNDLKTKMDKLDADNKAMDARVKQTDTWAYKFRKNSLKRFKVVLAKSDELTNVQTQDSKEAKLRAETIERLQNELAELKSLSQSTAKLVNYARTNKVFV